MRKIFLTLMVAMGLFFVANVQADTLFYARATGAEETPAPVETDATGLIVCSLNADQTQLTIIADISNLAPTASHIHMGAAGETGPVVFGLGSDYSSPIIKVWDIPSDMVDALLKGNLYFNAHSKANPDGEIRGQIGPVQP